MTVTSLRGSVARVSYVFLCSRDAYLTVHFPLLLFAVMDDKNQLITRGNYLAKHRLTCLDLFVACLASVKKTYSAKCWSNGDLLIYHWFACHSKPTGEPISRGSMISDLATKRNERNTKPASSKRRACHLRSAVVTSGRTSLLGSTSLNLTWSLKMGFPKKTPIFPTPVIQVPC